MRNLLPMVLFTLFCYEVSAQNDYREDKSDGLKVNGTGDFKKFVIPDFLNAEWFSLEGGNLCFEFYDDVMLSEGVIYSYEDVVKDGNNYIISFKDRSKRILSISKVSEENIDIQEKTVTIKYTKNRAICKIKPDLSVYTLPVFKNDSATYSGYIKDYNKGNSPKTIALHIDNILTGGQDIYMAKVQDNGVFDVKIPMYHPQLIYVSFNGYNGSTYLEPGRNLFTILGSDTPVYSGEMAALNYDLNMLEELFRFDFDSTLRGIATLNPEGYKSHLLKLQQEDFIRLDSVNALNKISKKAYQIKRTDFEYMYAWLLFDYDNNYSWASLKTRNSVILVENDYF